MGCGGSLGVDVPLKIPITHQISNSYINQFPLLIVNKLNNKFHTNCSKQINGMLYQDFKKLYQHINLTDIQLKNLYQFFLDNKKQILKFKQFMIKYAILIKCNQQILSKIIYQINKTIYNNNSLTIQQYNNFIKNQRSMFAFQPSTINQGEILNYQLFYKKLSQSGFYWIDYRNKFNLIQKDDIPFQAINKQLIDNQINDLQTGNYYYVLSASWFQRWSFYYQGQSHNMDHNSLKSTKLMGRQKKKRPNRFSGKQKISHQRVLSTSNYQSQSLIELPTKIQSFDIEGQYQQQLKEGLRPSQQCKYITEKLWKMLTTMHQPIQQFKRQAITRQNLQLYPKTIYYFESNMLGEINYNSFKMYQLGIKKTLSLLNNKQNITFFVKNFQQKIEKSTRMLAQCSVQSRFFVISTVNKIKFLQKNTRKQINQKNLYLGDKIYAYFPYQKTICQAYIININQDIIKIHYKGYSYRYQTQININEITLQEPQNQSIVQNSRKKQNIFKGIINIGNTCFINSIIQCLIATPVLDQYLETKIFEKSQAPLMYNLTSLANKLLNNQNVSPYDMKKSIDLNLTAFSGNDQHDAQQFLCLLLDKMSAEHKQKPNVVDQLFSGKTTSQVTCLKCKNVNNIIESFHTLSLPIPESQYNYYSIIVVPVYHNLLKKIVLKLHKTSSLDDYLNSFQQRIQQNKNQFIFVQMQYGTLRKVRSDLFSEKKKNNKVNQMGLSQNTHIYAFQKLRKDFFQELIRNRQQSDAEFYDYFSDKTIGFMENSEDFRKKKDHIKIQYLNLSYQIETDKIQRANQKNLYTLGTKIQQNSFHKIHQRKYNYILKKYQHFGLGLLINIPVWASYNDIILIVDKYMENLKAQENNTGLSLNGINNSISKKNKKNQSIIYRFIQSSKHRCLFCQKDLIDFKLDQQFQNCCINLQKNIPISWIAKKKSYSFYIDWIKLQNYNSMYFSRLQIDSLSKSIQQKKSQQKINLQECLNLFKQPQKVQMQCDKCKNNDQMLQIMISSLPTILILHMKQFRYTNQGHLIKLDIRLKWQKFIDISKYSINSKGNIYQLFAFVRHSGNSQSGHYTSMTKRKHPVETKRVWVNFDDQATQMVKQQQNNIDNAYLLFFKRVDMPTSAYLHFTDLQEAI